MPQAAAPQPLAYAPRPPGHNRKRWRRGKVVVAVLLIAAAGWYWLQPWRRVQIVYWQRRCMNMTPPADGQIEIRDPAKVAAVRNNPDYITSRNQVFPAVFWHPQAWTRYRNLCMSPGPHAFWDYPVIVFLGTRCAPGGSPRLVMVSSLPQPVSQPDGVGAIVIRPATLWREPESHARMMAISEDCLSVELSAGRADPNDASHIVIPCTIYHLVRQPSPPRAGQIDLYLQSDDTLRVGPLPEP